MKVIGAIAVLIAAFLGLAAYTNDRAASSLEQQINRQTGTDAFFGGFGQTMLNDTVRMRIESYREAGKNYAIGAAVIGVIGLLLGLFGGSKEAESSTADRKRKKGSGVDSE